MSSWEYDDETGSSCPEHEYSHRQSGTGSANAADQLCSANLANTIFIAGGKRLRTDQPA
jgi:hypothetical protein